MGEQECGNDHRNQRRYEQLHYHSASGDEALVPEHDGGHVADGRERAAGVGGYDNERGVDDAVVVVGHELAQYHHHHYCRRHVVEDGREEEGDEGYAPQQRLLALHGDDVAHKVEPAVLINQLHYGHRSHEEEQRGRRAAQVALHDLAYGRGHVVAHCCGDVTARGNHEKRPARHEHQQRDGCLVNFGQAFEGYAQIAEHEDDHNRNC